MVIANGQRSGLKYNVKMGKLIKLIRWKRLRLRDFLNSGLMLKLQILKEKANFKFGTMALKNTNKIV